MGVYWNGTALPLPIAHRVAHRVIGLPVRRGVLLPDMERRFECRFPNTPDELGVLAFAAFAISSEIMPLLRWRSVLLSSARLGSARLPPRPGLGRCLGQPLPLPRPDGLGALTKSRGPAGARP